MANSKVITVVSILLLGIGLWLANQPVENCWSKYTTEAAAIANCEKR